MQTATVRNTGLRTYLLGDAMKPKNPRKGHTLLELLVASTLLAIAIVPGLALMRESMRVDRKIESREMMTTLCISKMEQQLALISADSGWNVSSSSGTFSSEGYPHLHYIVSMTDDSASTTGGGNLMLISTTVWDDENQDGTQQANEPSTVFQTKVAQMTTYQE